MSPANREAVVTGKGDKYIRERARHLLARVSALRLGVRGGPMTASGIYQMIKRRGREAGVEADAPRLDRDVIP